MSLRRNLNAYSDAERSRITAAADANQNRLTAEQAALLRSLAEEAREPDAFDETLDSAEAELRIRALRAKIHHERRSGIDRRPRV